MSLDRFPEDEPLIQREPSPVLRVPSEEGEFLEFTHENTWVYRFTRMPELDHIFFTPQNGEGTYIFLKTDDERAVCASLIEAEFPYCTARYPTDIDMQYYLIWQSKLLDGDIIQLPKTE